jgi:hypothetical protein
LIIGYSSPKKRRKPLDNVLRNSKVGKKSDFVGVAGGMPGTEGGFTMAAFKASDVPPGTRLYTSPQAARDTTDFDAWYTKRYGKVDKSNVWENAQRADALEVWNAALASKEFNK